MSSPSLFSPLHIGPRELAHRVVMAPLTRMRAGPGNVPNALAPQPRRLRGARSVPGTEVELHHGLRRQFGSAGGRKGSNNDIAR
jgi:2,4-dienoyl-CoA reductase-like NADH-dependent reductase (Old Yellow Enzyme family)